MTDWPVKTLGDLMTVQNGFAFDSQYFSPSGKIGLIRIRDLKGGFGTETQFVGSYDDEYVVTAGDYLIGMDGEFRCYEWKGDPALLNQRVCRLRNFGKSLDARFLFHGINKFLKEIEDVTGYTTVKHLSSKSILAIEMPVPPLEEQKRIVALLDAATAHVTELTACYELARTHANNLFTSALREALESDQSAPLRTLDELCEEGTVKLGRGNIISKKDIAAKPGSYPIYSSARENEGKFGEYGDYMFDEEMITWSIDGGGRLFYRPKHKFSVTNVGGTLRVLDPRLLDIQYLHRVLQNLHSQRVFDWVFKAHPSVIRKVYDAIPMPPLAEQKRVVARLDSMRAKTSEMVAAYDAKLIAAKNLRQSILESAFRGDL